MVPSSLYGFLGAGLLGAFIAGSSAWYVQGLRGNAALDALRAEIAADRATQVHAALDDFVRTAKEIKDNATAAQADIGTLSIKLDAVRKEIKHAKPLPVDCKPDTGRMSALKSAVDATNETIAGRKPSRPVPATERPHDGRF